jgi:pimeloyl-ACP methyl ester carboxylesterase
MTMATIAAGAAELYCEVRGSGPPVLLIMGATGDAGHLAALAQALADEFTVVSYDRRGNSRSPRPPGWTTTSVDEQADDAAALLGALGLSSAAVFGTSSGGLFALGLALRHAERVRGLVLHEPALYSVLERPQEVAAAIGAPVRAAMAAGGPTAAIERFWRLVSGDANWERLDPGLHRRMLEGAETYLGVERGAFDAYRPDEAALAALAAPVQVVASEESAPFFGEMARWLAGRLGVAVVSTPGTHTPYLDRPDELARTVRPFLRAVSASYPAAS